MVSFADAIRNAFTGYATFSGRSTRAEYWWFFLFNVLVWVAAGTIDTAIFGVGQNVISTLVMLALLIPNIALAVRRSHDIGKSGWWVLWQFLAWLCFFIPGLIMWLYLRTREGDRGPNQYGPDPRDDSQEISYNGEVSEPTDDSSSDGINCPACYADNKPESKFCKKCGVDL